MYGILSLGADEGADGFAVGIEGEDGKGVFVVLRVGAVPIGGFKKVDLRRTEVEGLGNAGYLRGGEWLFVVKEVLSGGEFLAVEALVIDDCNHFINPFVGDCGGFGCGGVMPE